MYDQLKKDGELTPDMLSLLGITKQDQPEFLQKIGELELLAEETGNPLITKVPDGELTDEAIIFIVT